MACLTGQAGLAGLTCQCVRAFETGLDGLVGQGPAFEAGLAGLAGQTGLDGMAAAAGPAGLISQAGLTGLARRCTHAFDAGPARHGPARPASKAWTALPVRRALAGLVGQGPARPA